jgi:malonyl-CoA/methylmalonyl-CoA synthetase
MEGIMADSQVSILHAFFTICAQDPQRTCLFFDQHRYTYKDLQEAALRWTGYFQQRCGVERGERIALFLDNSPAFLAAYLGAQLAGAIVVLVNTQYKQVELRHILSDSEAKLCITDALHAFEVDKVANDVPALEKIVVDGSLWGISTAIKLEIDEVVLPDGEEIALIAYTSGTTGRSKGAMLRHRNLAANSHAVTEAWQWSADDCLLLCLPLFHIHGLGVGIHGTLFRGASVDLRARFDANEIYSELYRGRATMYFGVPTMYTRLINEARQNPDHQKAEQIRLFVSGSAALSPQTFNEFQELFGQAILERYGMTETIMNLTNPYEGERRPGTVGKPFPGQEARIVHVRTREEITNSDPGEIQVRGPHVFKGYWQRPDATEESFDSEGWFNTGDLGWRSDDGYFTISGRARELIISGGYNIYPREIEEVLMAHDAVAEAAVLGAPDPEFGEQVVAVIVARPDTDQERLRDELIAWCRDQLASYKKPRRILFIDALPRNAMGKVQKHLIEI